MRKNILDENEITEEMLTICRDLSTIRRRSQLFGAYDKLWRLSMEYQRLHTLTIQGDPAPSSSGS